VFKVPSERLFTITHLFRQAMGTENQCNAEFHVDDIYFERILITFSVLEAWCANFDVWVTMLAIDYIRNFTY
jgi:hypothetical protein